MAKVHGHDSEISLLIGEECRMNCQLLETALRRSRHLSVAGSAIESQELIAAYERTQPDVVVISGALKDGPVAGFRTTRELRSSFKAPRVVMLVEASQPTLVLEAFRCGARGIFCRDESLDVLCQCVKKVFEGEIWASNQQVQYLVEAIAETAPPFIVDSKGTSLLTKREMSLVRLVAEGRTNKDISRELNLSEHTVRNYLFRIFNKLGTSNRLELALYAIHQRDGDNGGVSYQE
ncbi:MAG TPA: response regulator transcription factor [Candidatus Acidoferrum sp.]|nr:response regulator transcription factor [Candidatus Acidoferrum sp.]